MYGQFGFSPLTEYQWNSAKFYLDIFLNYLFYQTFKYVSIIAKMLDSNDFIIWY